MKYRFDRILVATGTMLAASGSHAHAETRWIDYRTYPNGTHIPNGTVLTNQLAGYGVLLGARRVNEPVGLRGSVNFMSYGGSGQCDGYGFFSPDVFGAVAIFEFVDPITSVGIDAVRFEFAPGFQSGESLDIVGLNELNQVTASQTVGSCGSCAPRLELTGRFRKIEVRTRGNPGIGLPNCIVAGKLCVGYEACLTLLQQPKSVVACPVATTTLSVTPAGLSPFSFQWQYESAPTMWLDAANGTIPYGSGTMTVSNVATDHLQLALNATHGAPPIRFRCIVTNSCGSTTSDPATLAPCQADFTCDGQVDDADFVGFAAAYNILDCADSAMPASCPADLNGDGFVDDSDFVLFVHAYNELGCI